MVRSNLEVTGDLAKKISFQKNPSKAGATIVLHCHRHVFGSRTVSQADQMRPVRLGNFGNKVRMT